MRVSVSRPTHFGGLSAIYAPELIHRYDPYNRDFRSTALRLGGMCFAQSSGWRAGEYIIVAIDESIIGSIQVSMYKAIR